jgi:hypothetical protein
MKIIKKSFFLLLPLFFLIGFMPELSAKHHHKNYRKTSRSSLSFNFNVNPRPYPAYTVVTQTPAYIAPTPAYIASPPAYYQQVTVVRPSAPVYPVPVAVERPAVGLYLSPSFSFWGY